ncbi:MAG: 50S ribosomal protein L23 [Bacteroidota bacterium]
MSNVIIKPLVTEKAAKLAQKGQHIFIVNKDANKIEIKKQLEKDFKVKVTAVNTAIYLGKKITRYTRKRVNKGQKPLYKKATVTLKTGESLDMQSPTL